MSCDVLVEPLLVASCGSGGQTCLLTAGGRPEGIQRAAGGLVSVYTCLAFSVVDAVNSYGFFKKKIHVFIWYWKSNTLF